VRVYKVARALRLHTLTLWVRVGALGGAAVPASHVCSRVFHMPLCDGPLPCRCPQSACLPTPRCPRSLTCILTVCLSVCLSVRLSVCLSVWVCVGTQVWDLLLMRHPRVLVSTMLAILTLLERTSTSTTCGTYARAQPHARTQRDIHRPA
jgi:hypothetical protein